MRNIGLAQGAEGGGAYLNELAVGNGEDEGVESPGLSMRKGLGQLRGGGATQCDTAKPRLGVEIVFARFVDNPHHPMTSILFDHLIEPAKLKVIARDIAGTVFTQTNDKF